MITIYPDHQWGDYPVLDRLFGKRPKDHYVTKVDLLSRNNAVVVTCKCGFRLKAPTNRVSARRFDVHWQKRGLSKAVIEDRMEGLEAECDRLQKIVDNPQSEIGKLLDNIRILELERNSLKDKLYSMHGLTARIPDPLNVEL